LKTTHGSIFVSAQPNAGAGVFDGRLIQRATITGIVLQFAMVVLAHYVPWISVTAYQFGTMMISGVAGLIYARDFAKGYLKGAFGGAIAGGACGLIGICAANVLGDVPLLAVPIGAAITTMIGAIGGLFGQMAANIRKLSA